MHNVICVRKKGTSYPYRRVKIWFIVQSTVRERWKEGITWKRYKIVNFIANIFLGYVGVYCTFCIMGWLIVIQNTIVFNINMCFEKFEVLCDRLETMWANYD